jgi:ADP-heptose:LPS heptosyltransferase
MDKIVHQHRDYGIGNFINCTPAIKLAADHLGEKIPVLFDTKCVKEIFEKCDFIESIDKHNARGKPKLLSSSEVNQKIEDWKYTCNLVSKRLDFTPQEFPHTYVDEYESPLNTEYVVVVRGMHTNTWVGLKDPGDGIYKHIITTLNEMGKHIVFIGNKRDHKRDISKMEKWADKHTTYLDNIKTSLGLINGAATIISNDTGMYHAAGALNKKTFVMWKNTNFIKNKSPSDKCTHSMKGNWTKDFDKWIGERT